MAKTPSVTAESTAPASAPVTAPAVSAATSKAGTVASAKGPTQFVPESPTNLQRGVDAFADVFADLAGGSPEPEEKATPAPSKRREPAEPEQKPKAAEAKADEPKQDEAIVEGEEPEDDGAVLTEDHAANDEDEDGADDGKDLKGYEEKLFKAREKRRALEAELKTEREQREALSKKLETMAVAAPAGVTLPELSGAYANVREEGHVQSVVDWINEQDATLDDFLDTHEDSIEHPQFGVLDRKAAKQMRRNLAAEAGRADKVRSALAAHATRVTEATALARKLYPFAFDAASKHNAVVLDLVKAEPALNALPSKSLVLGRMAVGKMIEDAPVEIRRQISALLNGRAVKPAAAAATPAQPAKSVPSSAPSAPRQRAAPQPEPESDDDTRRLINGDPRAAQDWAAGLLG